MLCHHTNNQIGGKVLAEEIWCSKVAFDQGVQLWSEVLWCYRWMEYQLMNLDVIGNYYFFFFRRRHPLWPDPSRQLQLHIFSKGRLNLTWIFCILGIFRYLEYLKSHMTRIFNTPPSDCSLEKNTKYSGHNLYSRKGIKIGNMAGCARLCFRDSKCKFWTHNPRLEKELTRSTSSFIHRVSKCWLKTSDQGRALSTKGSTSGQKACGATG